MSVCLTCGDEGRSWELIYCMGCNACAVHRYCLKEYTPGKGVIEWKCEDCADKTVLKITPSRKSERIVIREDEAYNVRLGIKKKLYKNRSLKGNSKENSKSSENVSEVKENMPEKHVLPTECYPPKKRYFKESLVGNKENMTENVDFTPVSSVKVTEKIADNVVENDNYTPVFCVEEKDKTAEKRDSTYGSSLATVSANLYDAPLVSYRIWRGEFATSMCIDENVGMTAHLSTLSCRNEKVLEVAKALPPVLELDILPRIDMWPMSFAKCGPKDDNIALYFFPESDRYEQCFEIVNKYDRALKTTIDGVDLLIFSSRELPQEHWWIQNKYYLWGVFKKSSL